MRTNSESILAVTVPEDYPDDLIKRVAITSSIYPDPHTHIETVTYGDDGDSMHRLNTLLVGDGTRVTRPLKLLGQILLHPKRVAQVLFPKHWSRRTIILLVMQTLDNAIALRPHKGPFGTFWLKTEQDPERPIPTFIPIANKAAEWFAKRTGGIAQSSLTEALFNIPTTAHILGGAVIAPDPERGVVDARQRVFGYENLLVCDGSAVPGERRRQPVADDHRAGRARDEPRARGGGWRPGSWRRGRAGAEREGGVVAVILGTGRRRARHTPRCDGRYPGIGDYGFPRTHRRRRRRVGQGRGSGAWNSRHPGTSLTAGSGGTIETEQLGEAARRVAAGRALGAPRRPARTRVKHGAERGLRQPGG